MNNNIEIKNSKYNDTLNIRVCKTLIHFDVFVDGVSTTFQIEKKKLKEMLKK